MTTAQGLDQEIFHLMFRLGRAFARRRAHEGSDADLSMLQLQVLAFIGERSCSMSELAGEFQIGLPSATALIDRMARAGLLARAEDIHDRRVTRVGLTAAGRERLRRLRDRDVSELRAALRGIAPEDQRALVRIMGRLLDELGPAA